MSTKWKEKWKDIRMIFIQYVIALILTLALGALLIYRLGEQPLTAVYYIWDGAFGSLTKFGSTLRWMTPCLFTGIAVAFAFKSGIMNCGIQGQVYMGAITAATIGYAVPMPEGIHAFVCIASAGIVGMLWALIPAIMRLYFRIDEVITSLMFCFIATYITSYIVIWKIIGGKADSTASQANASPQIMDTARIPKLIKGTELNCGMLLGLAIVFIIFLIYKYTKVGYELKQIGQNIEFCKAGGINTTKLFLGVFLISGLISGLCGGIEVSGSYGRFNTNFSSNIGWDGIMIARVAGNNPLGVIAVSFVWGALKAGAMNMERLTTLNRLTVNIIQMFFVLLISVDFKALWKKFETYRQRRKIKKMEETV